MKASLRFFSSVALSITLLFGGVLGVSAHGLFKNALPENLRTWSTYGSPRVTSTSVTLHGADREWVYVDIDADRIDEAYIVLAAYVDKDDSRTAYSSTDRNRSGNPYLYAYYLHKNGTIKKYLSGSDLLATTHRGSDNVVYGIFPTVSGTETIRVFLKQSSVKNISHAKVNVTFEKPVLFEASTYRQARELVQDYARMNVHSNHSSSR